MKKRYLSLDSILYICFPVSSIFSSYSSLPKNPVLPKMTISLLIGFFTFPIFLFSTLFFFLPFDNRSQIDFFMNFVVKPVRLTHLGMRRIAKTKEYSTINTDAHWPSFIQENILVHTGFERDSFK